MPKNTEIHRRTPVKVPSTQPVAKETNNLPPVEKMEEAIRLAAQFESAEPANAHPGQSHEKHISGVVDLLYRTAAVAVGAIIVGVMTFVLPKLGHAQSNEKKPTIAMAQGKSRVPETKEAMPSKIEIVNGTRMIRINGEGKDVSAGNLSELGITAFDGNEKLIFLGKNIDGIYTFTVVHENWKGIIFLSQMSKTLTTETQVVVTNTNFEYLPEGKIYGPVSYFRDEFGSFILTGTMGLSVHRENKRSRYLSLTETFGVDNLKDPKFDETSEKVTFTVSNSTGKVEFYRATDGKLNGMVNIVSGKPSIGMRGSE